MRQLSDEAKEAIVLKVINRGSTSIKTIAAEHNISLSSVYTWLQRHRDGEPLTKVKTVSSKKNELTRSEKFNHLLATSELDEVSLGSYCRQHGFYTHQLKQWQKELMTTPNTDKNHALQAENKALKEDKKRLERELRRKEKALAEASALLIMKKKADLIWGVNEDD